MHEISVAEVRSKLARGEPLHLLDVREPEELSLYSLSDAEHIPMLDLFAGLKHTTAPADAEVVVVCEHGIRSLEAAAFLRRQGWPKARSLAGGLEAWRS